MILVRWIDKPSGVLQVRLGFPHLGGGVCWTPLRTWPQAKLRMKKKWRIKQDMISAGEKCNLSPTFKEVGARRRRNMLN